MNEILDRAIVEFAAGNIPVIITVRHDGFATHICGSKLPLVRDKDINDAGTAFLGFRAIRRFAAWNEQPSFLYNKIARNRCSQEIWGIYYESVLREARRLLGVHGRCFVFDLHRFYKHPPVGRYDIFFGTDHRRTVNSELDQRFASELFNQCWGECRAMWRVYLPDDEPKEGERFGATNPKTLVRWLKTEEPRVEAIQIEFYKSLLENGDTVGHLASALAKSIHYAIRK